MVSDRCVGCSKFLRKLSGKKQKILTEERVEQLSAIFQNEGISIGDSICGACKIVAHNLMKKKEILCPEDDDAASHSSNQSMNDDPDFECNSYHKSEEIELERLQLAIPRVVSTHKYYCVCGAANTITVVPFEARKQAYVKRRIFIPDGNRCCPSHLIKKKFYEEDLSSLKVFSNSSSISTCDLQKLLENLAVDSDSTLLDKISNFSYSEDQMKLLTGFTYEHIIDIQNKLSSMRNSNSRSVFEAIVVFLIKLRSGNSNRMIASFLGLSHEQLVSEYFNEVFRAFEKDILPFNFGLSSVNRDHLIRNETTKIAKELLNASDDNSILICDGTYIRHQKSSNNEYQRKSYSGQKKVPLCKPFTICTTTGYVVDMLGPYLANDNDAKILRDILDSSSSGLMNLLREGDKFVLDRGFRDVVGYLEQKSFEVHMPALKGKRSQLSCEESNHSRYVTKVRWAVEAIHGIVKQKFQLLDKKMDNKMLPKTGSLCKIACYLNNQFGKRLVSDQEFADEILMYMKSRSSLNDTLSIQVENESWRRKKVPFQRISSSVLLDFPEMTEKDLKILFTGTYQYSQAVSYLAEMMNDDNTINIYCLKDDSTILKFLIQSRHVNRKEYRCFIEYKPNSIGYSGILRYTCECANGKRTVGCCSHIASIIYYLSFARYQAKIIKPAEILSTLFNKIHAQPVINDDSDED